MTKNKVMTGKRPIISDEHLETEDIELGLLVEAIYKKYGYDFRNYAKASLKRRVRKTLATSGIENISALQHKVLYDVSSFEYLLLNLSINVTEMFRDPSFYSALREKIIPIIKSYPLVKIWHAGCATGEEVYSMAILLKEEGLLSKTQIYATDFNEVVLKKAKAGIFPIDQIKCYTANYQNAGGTNSFSDYYTAKYKSAVIKQFLRKKIVFADHNLVTDWVFGEMNLILCRNVLIYFDQILKDRVFKLFYESLTDDGFLCLGSKESLMLSKHSKCFESIVEKEKIYRKKN